MNINNDYSIAIGLAEHIIFSCSTSAVPEHNLRQHHLKLARETLPFLQDLDARAYLSRVIRFYEEKI